jgi:hypothetical protein
MKDLARIINRHKFRKHTLNLSIAVILFASLCSCAVLSNNRFSNIEIHTQPDSGTIRLDNDTLIKAPLILQVPRSYNDFKISLLTDTVEIPYKIYSHLSPEFMLGNLIFLYGSPIAYILDASCKQTIYSYDNSILLAPSTKSHSYKIWKESRKGQFYFSSSLPWFNFLQFDNGRQLKDYRSFMGLLGEVEYYHSPASFVSLSLGFTGISDIPIPVMDRWFFDTVEIARSFSAKLTNNHLLKPGRTENFEYTFGYGFSFTHYSYSQIFTDTSKFRNSFSYTNSMQCIGLNFNAQFRFYGLFHIGFNFLPSYYTISRHKWQYSSLQYFDFGITLPLGDYKKKKLTTFRYKPKLLD